MANHSDSFLSDPAPATPSSQPNLVAFISTPDPASNSVPDQPSCIRVKVTLSPSADLSSRDSLPEVSPESEPNPEPFIGVQKTRTVDESECCPNANPQDDPHTSSNLHHKAAEDSQPSPLCHSQEAVRRETAKDLQETASEDHPDQAETEQNSPAVTNNKEKDLSPALETSTADAKDVEDQSMSDSTEKNSRRSERKAKAFARVRLVLAHEQLIDDDNFLGFTNRKTYLPPKKRKKLCQFKAEHHQVKPKLPKPVVLSHGSKKAANKSKVEGTNTSKASHPKDKVKEKGNDESSKNTETSSVVTGEEKNCGTDSTANRNSIKPKRTIPKLEWFNCDYCHYKTSNKYYIRRHEMTHEKPKISFECHYCDYVTKSVIRYKEHEAQHTHEKPFKCQHCDYCSRSYTDFRRHQAKHASEKKYKCPHCDFTTKWSRNVSHHVLKHTTARPHKCHICGFSFKRIQDLKYHLYRHNDVKPISCDRCDFKCKTNYELRCHKLKHSDERFYACTHPGCSQKTKTKSDLTKHMNIHNVEKKFICGVCQKGFNAKSTLAKHVRIHGDRVLLKCDICQKNLKTRASLQGHLKLHQGLYPFTCDICHRRFAVKWNLLKHQETHTLGDRPYRCPICPYGARTMEHLLTHIGSMHGKSYAYFCEVCRKPFKRYGQLKIHMGRMHETTLSQTAPLNMESMLKEVEPSFKKGVKEEELVSIGDESLELVEIKQEPVETVSLDPTRMAALITDNSSQCTTNETRSGTDTSHSPLDQLDIKGEESSEFKSELNTSLSQEGKPVATVGIYNGFTLPLATKGFEFNLEKRGKKPDSWFMDLQNMPSKAADKHKQYLYKKEHGLLVNHKPRLPKDKVEREAERRRRKLEKFIISCRVSSKSDTTLIFQTEKQKKKCLKIKKKALCKSVKRHTVAALLQRSEKNKPCSTEGLVTNKPCKEKGQSKHKLKKKSGEIQLLSTQVCSSIGKEETEIEETVLPLKEASPRTDSVGCPRTPTLCGTSPGHSTITSHPDVGGETDISTETVSVKRKRGRPKGSKNKCLQLSSHESKNNVCPDIKLKENINDSPLSKTRQPRKCAVKTKLKRTLRSVTGMCSPSEKVESGEEKGFHDTQPIYLNKALHKTVIPMRCSEDGMADNRKAVTGEKESVTEEVGTSETTNTKKPTLDDSNNVLSDGHNVLKRKRGRPKGSLNKKTLARMASTKVCTSFKQKGERKPSSGEKNFEQFVQTDLDYQAAICSPNSQSHEIPDAVTEESSTGHAQPDLEAKALGRGKDHICKETEGQLSIRQCSVTLSVIRDDPLKQRCHSLQDNNSDVLLKKGENLNTEQQGLGLTESSNKLDDQMGTCVSAVGEINKPLGVPAVSGGIVTSNVNRKRRKPNKSEIRRKCRKPGSSQVGLFSCIYEEGDRPLIHTGQISITSETCVKAEVLSDDTDGVFMKKPIEPTFQSEVFTDVSPGMNTIFIGTEAGSGDGSKRRPSPSILTQGNMKPVKQEPSSADISCGKTFQDSAGYDSCPDSLSFNNTLTK